MKGSDQHPRRPLGAALAPLLALAAVTAAGPAAGSWRLEVEPAWVVVSGHDQHVLTTRRAGATEALELDTDDALGYRAAALWERGRWDWGLDFFIHRTDQAAGPLRRSAGAGEQLVFELPGRSFVSTGPDETLFYQTLEDTTVELWVVDLYARRGLRGDEGPWAVLLGVRNADFDNDYRAVGAVEGIGGTRIDASSNYSRMIGPLVGLAVGAERGRHAFEAGLRQSVVFGDIELARTLLDFEGPVGPFAVPPEEVPPGLPRELLATTDSITVPMTDLLLAWRVQLGERWSLGARFDVAAWWDLAVPPGVVPGRADRLEETTLVVYGLGATLGVAF